MSEAIIIIDSSEIREGKLDELRKAMVDLAEFVGANEPQVIAYHVYLQKSGTELTVLQVHPDSASAEFHMKVAGPAFRQFGQLLRLARIDIYGKPSYALLERLREKACMLGGGPVVVHALHAGFARFGASGAVPDAAMQRVVDRTASGGTVP